MRHLSLDKRFQWCGTSRRRIRSASRRATSAAGPDHCEMHWKVLPIPAPWVTRMQVDAQPSRQSSAVVSTDPPYYDNVGYADLSDFFYVWLRRSLKRSSPISSPHSLCPRPKSWSPLLTATAAKKGGGVLPRRDDAGDAPPGRTGAPGLPGHHLLRLQAVRNRQRRRHCQYWLGDVSGSGDPRRLRRHRHLADANGASTESTASESMPSPPASSSSAARARPMRPPPRAASSSPP